MAQDHAAPRVLFALPAVTGTGNGPVPPVTGPVTVPVTLADGVTGNAGEHADGAVTEPMEALSSAVPLTAPERARLAVTHWGGTAATGAGQMWLHPGRLVHGLYTGKPGSLAEHRAYVKSREWVPPELDGKAAAFIAATGIAYHLLIARPLKAGALIVSASADRPLRLAGLVAFLTVAFFLLANYL
jgi:hypothetical protein